MMYVRGLHKGEGPYKWYRLLYIVYFLLPKSGAFQGCCPRSLLFLPVGVKQNRRLDFLLEILGEDFKVEDM